MDKINKLQKILDKLTDEYLKRGELVLKQKQDGAVFYDSEDNEIDVFAENENWFIESRDKILSRMESECMSLEDKVPGDSRYFTKLTDGLTSVVLENDEDTDVNLENTDQEPSEIEVKEGKDIIKDHKKYITDFSKKIGYGVGMFLTNHFLVSMGLPPTALIKPLVVGGVQLTGSVLNVIAPYAAPFVAPCIPSAFFYIKKEFRKIKAPKVEEQPIEIDPPIESHSLWEFVNLVVSITYKALKRIHDLF